MTSIRKIKANRANARASTGPTTPQGRAHAARNALRHALSVSVLSDPFLSEEVDALAHEIAGPDAVAEIQEPARRIAEAEIDLRRARYACLELLTRALGDQDDEFEARVRKRDAVVRGLARVNGPFAPMPYDAVELRYSTPKGPLKLASILSDTARQLLAMERYERRARSRRKFAIRAYDEVMNDN